MPEDATAADQRQYQHARFKRAARPSKYRWQRLQSNPRSASDRARKSYSRSRAWATCCSTPRVAGTFCPCRSPNATPSNRSQCGGLGFTRAPHNRGSMLSPPRSLPVCVLSRLPLSVLVYLSIGDHFRHGFYHPQTTPQDRHNADLRAMIMEYDIGIGGDR